MAEPLSAFDAARVRWGWGTSSDPAERQRFAEAGLSPLTSEERMRMERGWGASPLASKESREAMVAEEVRRGDRPAWQLPEAYGGRPTGTTRRAIRMQEAWDAQQAAILAREQEAREIEEFNSTMALRDLEYQTKDLALRLQRSEIAADLLNKKIIDEQAEVAIGIMGKYPDTPEGIATATAEINKNAPRAWESEIVGKHYYYKDKNAAAVVGADEARSADAEQQAQLRADIVTYEITPEQQKEMLEPNLPAGVVRFDPLKAMPVIAAAKKAQEAAKETKAEEKETKKGMASKEDEYQKALAEYDGLLAEGTNVDDEAVAKAKAKTRAAAAVLGLPKVTSEDDLKKYDSGDRVLAPDGITVITIP